MLASWKKSYDQPRQHIQKQRHYFANKGPSSQSYGFSNSHIQMWELDNKKTWALKNWRVWTVVLEKTLESPLDCKEIQPVHPKGNQSRILIGYLDILDNWIYWINWIFIGRTDAEAEASIFWPPYVKSQLTGKDPEAGKDWRQEKGRTEDEMVGWHHQLNGHESEQTPGNRGAWCAPVHGVGKTGTQLSDWTTVTNSESVWITINCGKFWKRWEYPTTWSASWEICMQVRKQQLELDMEQQTGSK